MGQYEIEAIVTVDARGQVLLPKDVRSDLGLEPGSKLAVVVMRSGGAPCCVSLMPLGPLESAAREVITAGTGKEGEADE